MPGRWWDTGRGKIPPLPAPASGQEVGHRSFQRYSAWWQPAALLRLLGTLLTLAVSMSPAAALKMRRRAGASRPVPAAMPGPCGRKLPRGKLSRNQSVWLPPATSFNAMPGPLRPSLPPPPALPQAPTPGAQASPGDRRRSGESLGHARQIQRGPSVTKTGVLYWEAQTAPAAAKAPLHIRAAFLSNERRGPPFSFRRPLRLWYDRRRNAAGKHAQVGRGVPAGVPAKMQCSSREEHGGSWVPGRRCRGAHVAAGL